MLVPKLPKLNRHRNKSGLQYVICTHTCINGNTHTHAHTCAHGHHMHACMHAHTQCQCTIPRYVYATSTYLHYLAMFKMKEIGGRQNRKRGVGGFSPGKIFKFKVAKPLKFNSRNISYSTENCRRLLPVRIFTFSHDSEGKTQDLDFQFPGFTCRLRLTSLLNLCLRFLQALHVAQRKVENSS